MRYSIGRTIAGSTDLTRERAEVLEIADVLLFEPESPLVLAPTSGSCLAALFSRHVIWLNSAQPLIYPEPSVATQARRPLLSRCSPRIKQFILTD